MFQVTLNNNGFYFFNEQGKFVNPGLPKDYRVKGYKLLFDFVQVIALSNDWYCLKLIKANLRPSKGVYNEDWYKTRPWKYVDSTGNFSNPVPSGISFDSLSKVLQVVDLKGEIAMQFIDKSTIYTKETELLQKGKLQYTYRSLHNDPMFVMSDTSNKLILNRPKLLISA